MLQLEQMGHFMNKLSERKRERGKNPLLYRNEDRERTLPAVHVGHPYNAS